MHSRPLRNFSFVALKQSVMQTLSSKAERFNCRNEFRLIYEIYLNKTTKHQFLDTRYVAMYYKFCEDFKKKFYINHKINKS